MSDTVARMKEKVVTINVGKNGITESLINEINLQLEKRGVVRVRMLKNFRSHSGKSKEELVGEIVSKVKGKVMDFRGFVLTLERC